MDLSLLNLETLLRKYGRGVVAHAVDGVGDPTVWDGTSALILAHLTDTEGNITHAANATEAKMTMHEVSGDVPWEVTYTGEAPVITAPLFMADPDLLSIVSPIGSQHAGHIRVREVTEHTVVIFPEALFRNTDGTYGELTYDATGWKLDGVALDAAHQTLLAHTIWYWRCYFSRPDREFKGGHGNDAKNIVSVQINGMLSSVVPDGQRVYTTGDPALYSIDILGTS